MAPCTNCGLPIREGDRHRDVHVRDDGAIVVTCRMHDADRSAQYVRILSMPQQRLFFSQLPDPQRW